MEKELPILIFLGEDICYNTLNEFALDFGTALEKKGKTVRYFDITRQKQEITSLFDEKFEAVIGFQAVLFFTYLESAKCNLVDFIQGPKYCMWVDHPVGMAEFANRIPKDFYLLTHDRDYISFAEKYYRDIKEVFLLPPGGVEKPEASLPWNQREYEMVFVGTYVDYRKYFSDIHNENRQLRFLANRFLAEMRKHPNEPAEQALEQALKKQGFSVEGREFANLLWGMRTVVYCVKAYYREKIVALLLQEGFSIEVYGGSWKKSPFATHAGLHIHKEVTRKEALLETGKSRMALNIMSWHKDGFTERVANSMLCKTAFVSDKTRCLEEQYADEKEILLFDLEHLAELPKKLRKNEKHLETIGKNGYEKAKKEDTWEQRADLFLQYYLRETT